MNHSVCCLAPVNESDVTLCGEQVLVVPVGPEGVDPSCVVCLDLERGSWCPDASFNHVCLQHICTRRQG